MEQIAIAVLFGLIGGGVLMWFMKDKISAVDATLHAKLDSLHTKVDAIPTTVASVGQQVANVVLQNAPKAPPAQ